MLLASNARAVSAGLTFRPIAETIRDTFEWDRREGATAAELPGRVTPIAREKEMRLLGSTAAP
jgi:hypothetical protein